jgi:hypothetical protein
LTVLNTVYETVIKSFTNQWAGLKDPKWQTQPVVPKITGEVPIMQWVGVFDDFHNRKIGVRTFPLSYVTRETALASRPASVHRENLPHGEEFDSIEEELVAQASHMHPLYCEDNATVYYCLKEAVWGTQYASSLKPFQQIKNGRGALFSIIQHFTRANKWQAELSMRDKFLHEKVWNGQTLYLLERFISQLSGAFIAMKDAAEHVPFQLPNEFTRVGFLRAGITSSNAGLQAAMANIKSDADPTSETSKLHHFKLAATYLQPFCPVLKKFQSGAKRDAIKISDVSGSGFGTKPSAGKRGVSLWYHTSEEYEALTQPQKDELLEW